MSLPPESQSVRLTGAKLLVAYQNDERHANALRASLGKFCKFFSLVDRQRQMHMQQIALQIFDKIIRVGGVMMSFRATLLPAYQTPSFRRRIWARHDPFARLSPNDVDIFDD